MRLIPVFFFVSMLPFHVASAQTLSESRLSQLLKRFPAADTNKDGQLTKAEAVDFSQTRQRRSGQLQNGQQRGVPTQFSVHPGWSLDSFPKHAVCHLAPSEILDVYQQTTGNQKKVPSYTRPDDGALRIVATGHSFMAPGFGTFPRIASAAGLKQPPLMTHTGGGITGSARYKWEQENGIFQFDGKPVPKLLASIANAEWDAMMWGPYYNDRPEYYSCWIDFCLKYNSEMKFYLSDAWPQLSQLDAIPTSEDVLTLPVFKKMESEKRAVYGPVVTTLAKSYPGRIFVLPTSRAMVLAVESYLKGDLDGVQCIHTVVGGSRRALWSDRLGHLGPGFGNLEGYVFYATMYGRSPELLGDADPFGGAGEYPSRKLDREFRRIAWQAVVTDPLSGVVDRNENGIADSRE